MTATSEASKGSLLFHVLGLDGALHDGSLMHEEIFRIEIPSKMTPELLTSFNVKLSFGGAIQELVSPTGFSTEKAATLVVALDGAAHAGILMYHCCSRI